MNSLEAPENFVQYVDLVRLRGGGQLRGAPPAASWGRRLLGRWGWLAAVVTPTLLTALYMMFLAAPRYASEAEFVIRTPGNGQANQLANLVQGTTIIRSVDDGYVAAAFVVSRDAMRDVVESDGFKKMLQHSGADLLWRYPPLLLGDNEDRLYRWFTSLVSVSVDQSTGIITLNVQAFTPEDARNLAIALLAHTEKLINIMNQRAEQDAVRVAQKEVDDAKQQAYAATDSITAFRDREKVIDPMEVTKSTIKNITELSMSAAETSAQLTVQEKTSPQSPQISGLKVKIASINAQIEALREQLAGPKGALAPTLAQYEKLTLAQKFAVQTFSTALASLESARVDALKQRAFLETVTAPTTPDRPAYPLKLLSIFGVFIVTLMIYRIGRIFVTDTVEHASR